MRRARPRYGQGAFTLLEVMLAVAISAAVMSVAFLCFSTVSTAWKKAQALGDNLHHGDLIIEQLSMALRSAYFPESVGGQGGKYGFQHTDGGEGENARDAISWVKLGKALVGDDCPFAGTPHRVQFTVEEDEKGRPAAMVRAWRLHGQADEFSPEQDVEPVFLPGRIQGFNCRMAYRKVDGEVEWLDEWEETNRIPSVVEVTVTLPPLQEGEKPVMLQRLVKIPVGVLSWKDSKSTP